MLFAYWKWLNWIMAEAWEQGWTMAEAWEQGWTPQWLTSGLGLSWHNMSWLKVVLTWHNLQLLTWHSISEDGFSAVVNSYQWRHSESQHVRGCSQEYVMMSDDTIVHSCASVRLSLVPRPLTPPGEKRSGEQSQISWAYYPKRVMTNEIARSVIIM